MICDIITVQNQNVKARYRIFPDKCQLKFIKSRPFEFRVRENRYPVFHFRRGKYIYFKNEFNDIYVF